MNFHIEKRREFVSKLPEGGIVLLINDRLENMKCSRNFFYLTGIESPNCAYFLSKTHGETHEIFFTPHDNPRRVHFDPPVPSQAEVEAAAGISDVRYIEELEPVLLAQAATSAYIGFDLDPRVSEYPMLKTRDKCAKLMRDYPAVPIRNVFYDITALRLIKTDEEMKHVLRARDVTDRAIRRCMRECRVGMYEYELEAIFRHEVGMSGLTLGFPSIIAAGGNEFSMHYCACRGKISDGDLVLMDVGAEDNGYCVDVSRVFPANGRFSPKQRQIYEAALKANLAVQRAIEETGASSVSLNAACRDSAAASLVELGLIKNKDEVTEYYWHRCSHQIGLDVHDADCYDFPVEEGQLFSVDAGIYVTDPAWRVGLRVEDDAFVARGKKCELITRGIPREIDEIEAVCAGEIG